jgi:pimeloyl-ACP methyl ester carboxylesterase/quercetin dioxygenase-like cupin family protein
VRRTTWVLVASTLAAAWWSVVAAQQATAPGQDSYADLSGVRLRYRDSGGSGVPVVLLHAATGSVESWVNQFPAFTAAGYRVIAYDRRGFGRSVVDPSGPQPGTGVDDLDALMNHLRIESFHLVGVAAGGFVALDYAVTHPRRLRRLVFAHSMGGIRDEAFLEVGRRLRPPQFEELPTEFRELSPSYRAVNPDGTRRWLEIARTNRPQGPRLNQPMKNTMTAELLRTIPVPTLVVAGEADHYMPPPLMRMIAAEIKGAETAVIPEVAHASFWERPDEFNRLVVGFLQNSSQAQNPKPAGPHFSLAGMRPTFVEADIEDIQVVVSSAASEGRLSLIESTWLPGFSVSPHYHTTHAETFYIVSGQAEWTIGGRTHVMNAGDLVHIPANTVHSVKVAGGRSMRSLMFFQPGGYEETAAIEASFTAQERTEPKVRQLLERLGDIHRVSGPSAPPTSAGSAPKGTPVFSVRGKRPTRTEAMVENIEVGLSSIDSEGRLSIIESDWLAGFSAPPHSHRTHAETFYVFSGRVEWTVGGETRVLGAGDVVHIPPNVVHSVRVLEKIHTLWIGTPGGLDEGADRAGDFVPAAQTPRQR